MSVEKNISTIRRYFDEVYNQRNPDAGDALLSPHIVMHGSPVKSVAAWKQYATAYLTAFPDDLMVTIEDIFAEGEKVVARFTVSATHDDPFLGIIATGKKVRWMGIAIFYLNEDRIVEVWGVNDIYSVMQQIGAI